MGLGKKLLNVTCKICDQEMKLGHYLPDDVVVYHCNICKTFKILNKKTGKPVETGNVIRRGA
jgi:hypothetical protein